MIVDLKIGDKVKITNFEDLCRSDIQLLVKNNGIVTVSDVDHHPCTDCSNNKYTIIYIDEIEGALFGQNDFEIIKQ